MKKKIVFVYHSLTNGGVEREIVNYCKILSDNYSNRIEIHVFLNKVSGELLNSLPVGVKLQEVRGKSEKVDLTYIVNLFIHLNKLKPDSVVGFMQDINLNIILTKIVFFMKFKLVISEHTFLTHWQAFFKTHFIKKFLIKLLYKRADLCLVISKIIAYDLIKNFNFPKKNIFLIPNFLTKPITRTKRNPKNYFLYVGRISDEKNTELLIDALYLLKTKTKIPRLVIVGNGPQNFLREKIYILKMSEEVVLKGYKENVDLFYQEALALVVPSVIEGKSRVILEAMAYGCPVISSNFFGRDPSIISEETATIFENKSAASLSNKMYFFLNNPKVVYSKSVMARKNILKIYSDSFYKEFPSLLYKTIC